MGGNGFSADDSGFRGGTLAVGSVAVYTIDVTVQSVLSPGSAIFSCYVNADGIVSIPVVGRIRIAPANAADAPRIWLPFVEP